MRQSTDGWSNRATRTVESSVTRQIVHRPDWRRLLSFSLVAAGLCTLFLDDPPTNQPASLLMIAAGIAIFLPKEYFTITHARGSGTITLEYRGKRVSAPDDASLVVLETDGGEDVIVLDYPDGTSRRMWEGARLGSIAQVVKELLEIEHDLRVY